MSDSVKRFEEIVAKKSKSTKMQQSNSEGPKIETPRTNQTSNNSNGKVMQSTKKPPALPPRNRKVQLTQKVKSKSPEKKKSVNVNMNISE